MKQNIIMEMIKKEKVKQEINTKIYLEEKNKKREYARNRCHYMSHEKKQKPKKYQKITLKPKKVKRRDFL